MRYLHFVSLLLVSAACAHTLTTSTTLPTGKGCLSSAAPDFTRDLYQGSIDVSGRHVSGLMFFKTMPDSSSRIVFTTETGLTFFDFEWDKHGHFTPKHVIKKLNRKVIISMLRKDLELILVPDHYTEKAILQENGNCTVSIDDETLWYTVNPTCKSALSAEVKHDEKLKTKASFFTSDKNVPDSVYIQHLNFDLQISLRRIE